MSLGNKEVSLVNLVTAVLAVPGKIPATDNK